VFAKGPEDACGERRSDGKETGRYLLLFSMGVEEDGPVVMRAKSERWARLFGNRFRGAVPHEKKLEGEKHACMPLKGVPKKRDSDARRRVAGV